MDKWDEDIEKQREEDKKRIDTKKYPHNKNVSIEFTRSMKKKVECGGGQKAYRWCIQMYLIKLYSILIFLYLIFLKFECTIEIKLNYLRGECK